MRVLSVNKFYHLRGGSERYFFDLNQLLADQGHEIIPFAMASIGNRSSSFRQYFVSEIDFFNSLSLAQKVRAAARVVYSSEARKKIEALLTKTRPQLAHLHNIAHQISPSILHTLRKHNIPVVQTLHDYKLVCPTYSMLVQNQVCERCLGGNYYHAALQRCNRGLQMPSLLSTIEMYVHAILRVYNNVDLFISPSRFLQSKIIEGGITPQRIEYIPYFVHLEKYVPRYDNEGYLLYTGRLVSIKGVDLLLEAMREFKKVRLIVAGGGELRSALEAAAAQYSLNVSFVGHQSGKRLRNLIRNSMAVVVPSRWYENLPYAVIESFALGKPVVGARIGGIPELIDDQVDGLLFEPNDPVDLAAKLRWLVANPDRLPQMGRLARSKAERCFNPQDHYQRIIELYTNFTT